MKSPRKFTAFAVFGLSLGLATVANAQSTNSTAFGNWQVTEMRAGGAEMDLPYCAMSNYFSNDVLLVMSKNSDGSGSIAMDFNSSRLSLEKKYPVTINVGNRAQYKFDAYPGNRQALVLELQHADDLFLPMAKYPDIKISVASNDMSFNLGPFVNGMNDLNGCLAALTGTQAAAIDLSTVTIGTEPTAVAAAPATTPMGGVAQAMWKSDAAATPAQAPLPSVQSGQAPMQEQPGLTVMSSNAEAQGVDMDVVYAQGMADAQLAQAMPAAGEEVNESIKFSTNRQKDSQTPSMVITASEQKPMNPTMDGQAEQVQTNYEAMRAQQMGQQPVSVANLDNNSHSNAGGLSVSGAMDPSIYQAMREKYRSPVYDRRGVNVPLTKAIEQISPPGYSVNVTSGVKAQTPVSWNGGRPWRVLLDDMLEPLGYSAIVTENQITLAAKKN